MKNRRRRGRTGPTVDDFFDNSGSAATAKADPALVTAANNKGFTVEYSDQNQQEESILFNLTLKEMTIVALIFVLFLKLSLVPALNVLMGGYAITESTDPFTSASASGTHAAVAAATHSHDRTCRSASATFFHGADVVLLGGGGVAQEIMLQVASSTHLATNGGELNVMAVFDSAGGISTSPQAPMTAKALRSIVRAKRASNSVINLVNGETPVFSSLQVQTNFSSLMKILPSSKYSQHPCTSLLVVVDVTGDASEAHAIMLSRVLQDFSCARLVLANKAPLSSVSYEDVADAAFQPISTSALRRVYFEATVGAALPVVQTLRGLNDVGDGVIKIEAILSGTASYVLSNMMQSTMKDIQQEQGEVQEQEQGEERGQSTTRSRGGLVDSLQRAFDLGFTESNPCVDLSGVDVIRKGIILGRLITEDANLLSMADVEVTPLSENCTYTAGNSVRGGSTSVGLLTVEDAKTIENRVAASLKSGRVLRYVAVIEAYGTANSKRVKMRVGLKSYGLDHPFGDVTMGRRTDQTSGKGKAEEEEEEEGRGGAAPENVLVIHTSLYNKYPLVIRGPGAGAALTASAVIGDLLRCVAAK